MFLQWRVLALKREMFLFLTSDVLTRGPSVWKGLSVCKLHSEAVTFVKGSVSEDDSTVWVVGAERDVSSSAKSRCRQSCRRQVVKRTVDRTRQSEVSFDVVQTVGFEEDLEADNFQ